LGIPLSSPDELEQIPGLPPWVAPLLRASGIRTAQELSAYDPASLAKLLRERIFAELTPSRIDEEDWIGRARGLSTSGERADNASSPGDEGHDRSRTDSETARQLAGFTVFFDALPDGPEGGAWRVRLYHDETGEEVALPSIDPGPWVAWILGKALDEPGPALHHLIVTIEESRVIGVEDTRAAAAGDDDATRSVEVTLRVDGLPQLERALGRATIGAVLGEQR